MTKVVVVKVRGVDVVVIPKGKKNLSKGRQNPEPRIKRILPVARPPAGMGKRKDVAVDVVVITSQARILKVVNQHDE
jgi:hypothetical protein